jgi:hypothetical protein
VLEVVETGKHQFQITSDSKHDLRTKLFDFAVSNNCSVLEMNMKEQKLEDIFHNLTK